MKIMLGAAMVVVFFSATGCEAQSTQLTILKGACAASSHISEGPENADLSKRRRSFFCDSALVSINQQNGNVMVQFSDKAALHQPPVAFAGGLDEPNMLTVERIYIEPGKPLTPNDGHCKLFFVGGASRGRMDQVTDIVCGARIVDRGRATVPVITFKVARSR